MNHTYRLVWNDQAQRYVPAPETARSRGRGKARAACKPTARLGVAATLAFALPLFSVSAFAQAAGALAANALPTGAQVVAGQAGIAQSGSQMTVTQGSDRAIINWQSFNIGSNAAVQFIQPSTSAVALNRVIAGDASQIQGKLTANGQVWLINPNGVVFGKGSQVDVGGLVASTLNITDADFLAGKAVFSRNGATGGVLNQGTITAADGGLVALLAPTVSNEGIITARLGSVAMAAGDRITLDSGANGLLQVAVDPATVKTLVENRQLIVADGGQVVMTGKAADALSASVVANTGTIQAHTIAEREGRILLLADMEHGEVQHSGLLDASAPNGGNGGFVETSAAKVTLAAGRKVTTQAPKGKSGTWLIDPTDFTIAASGGDTTGVALSADLAASNIVIESSQGRTAGHGDINVNDAVSWNANTLSLIAARDININAVMTASGTSRLVMATGRTNGADAGVAGGTIRVGLAPGQANGFTGRVDFTNRSGTGFLTINGDDYSVIDSAADLQVMANNLQGHYALGSNINAGSIGNFNPAVDFTGAFDGLGHVISNLTINQPYQIYVGLFGIVDSGGSIRNVGLAGGSVAGGWMTGGLVGANYGSITNVYTTGNVASAYDIVGGLAGYNGGSITNAYATGSVTGASAVGGLVGYNDGYSSSFGGSGASITNAYATGPVRGLDNIGGLVGYNDGNNGNARIANAYATGSVTGSSTVGGLVGYNSGDGGIASITTAYATGSVTGTSTVGGLVGLNDSHISNAYAAGAVTGTGSNPDISATGGLVGMNAGDITDVYAKGPVSGANNAGGLVGYNNGHGTIGNAYATGSVTVTGNGGRYIGGLVGFGGGATAATTFYATTDANGNAINNAGYTDPIWGGNNAGTGRTLAQLTQKATFTEAGWDPAVWSIVEGSMPQLRTLMVSAARPAIPLTFAGTDTITSGSIWLATQQGLADPHLHIGEGSTVPTPSHAGPAPVRTGSATESVQGSIPATPFLSLAQEFIRTGDRD